MKCVFGGPAGGCALCLHRSAIRPGRRGDGRQRTVRRPMTVHCYGEGCSAVIVQERLGAPRMFCPDCLRRTKLEQQRRVRRAAREAVEVR